MNLRATPLTLAGCVIAALPSAAAADSSRIPDPVRDAPGYGDITSLRISNAERKLVVVMKIRSFDRDRTSAMAIVHPKGRAGPFYSVGWNGSPDKSVPKRFFLPFTGDPDGAQQTCQHLRVRVSERKSRVRIDVPQRCLPDARPTLRVMGLTEGRDTGDLDTTRTLRVKRG